MMNILMKRAKMIEQIHMAATVHWGNLHREPDARPKRKSTISDKERQKRTKAKKAAKKQSRLR
jgi:hypothetical protein